MVVIWRGLVGCFAWGCCFFLHLVVFFLVWFGLLFLWAVINIVSGLLHTCLGDLVMCVGFFCFGKVVFILAGDFGDFVHLKNDTCTTTTWMSQEVSK